MDKYKHIFILFNVKQYSRFKKEIEKNPNFLVEPVEDGPWHGRLPISLLAHHSTPLEIRMFLCEMAERIDFPRNFTKKDFLVELLAAETDETFGNPVSVLVSRVEWGEVKYIAYAIEKLGPQIWDDVHFYYHDYLPLCALIEDRPMFDLLLATHSEKEFVLLKKLDHPAGSKWTTLLERLFEFRDYLPKLLQYPAIRAKIREYRYSDLEIHPGKSDARKFSLIVQELFEKEELNMVEHFPSDNSLLGIVGRILAVETYKKHEIFREKV